MLFRISKSQNFHPLEKTVKTLVGTGEEGTSNGNDQTCSFTQGHGICSLNKTLVVSDIAAGTIKLIVASGLSSTVSFLKVLGRLYDSFGIHAQSTGKAQVSFQYAVNKISCVNEHFKRTVDEVKLRHSLPF